LLLFDDMMRVAIESSSSKTTAERWENGSEVVGVGERRVYQMRLSSAQVRGFDKVSSSGTSPLLL